MEFASRIPQAPQPSYWGLTEKNDETEDGSVGRVLTSHREGGEIPVRTEGEIRARLDRNRTATSLNGTPQAYTYFKNAPNPLNGQRLQGDGTRTYGYDAAGNATSVTGSQTLTLGYDADNRLESIAGDVAATYTYDYQGRRTSKTVGGTTTTYLYDGLNLVAETTNGQTTYFLNGPGIDEPLAMTRAGSLSYFSADGLGSVVATNNSAGTVSHSAVFDPWGNVKAENGTRTHPFTYTGREVGEAGLHFYRARYYQPSIGRFSQEDPLGLADGPNVYTYVHNDPTADVDPTGLACGATPLQELFAKDRAEGVFDFTIACLRHDRCYSTCGRAKKTCDDGFLSDMLHDCNVSWRKPKTVPYCRAYAYLYYWAVATQGGGAYAAAQDAACRGCKKAGPPAAPPMHWPYTWPQPDPGFYPLPVPWGI